MVLSLICLKRTWAYSDDKHCNCGSWGLRFHTAASCHLSSISDHRATAGTAKENCIVFQSATQEARMTCIAKDHSQNKIGTNSGRYSSVPIYSSTTCCSYRFERKLQARLNMSLCTAPGRISHRVLNGFPCPWPVSALFCPHLKVCTLTKKNVTPAIASLQLSLNVSGNVWVLR